MNKTVELSSLDLRYQGHRLRDGAREARLLASISERGIEEPLQGVDTAESRFLLNGFKRYRCAKKLGIFLVPYVSLADEEPMGIVSLMRVPTGEPLGVLEQARFIDDLLTVHRMSVAEAAEILSRSKGWVSMRRNLLSEMSPQIQQILFRGAFPAYSYMYIFRRFMRMNLATQPEIEGFVKALAGQRLSVRDIERLARAYFSGPASLRRAVDEGKWRWSLDQMKGAPEDREGCSGLERGLLKDLQILEESMQRVLTKCRDSRLKSSAFYAQADLLTGGLLTKLSPFRERMKEFHDRCRDA